jgi:hypothetical protein
VRVDIFRSSWSNGKNKLKLAAILISNYFQRLFDPLRMTLPRHLPNIISLLAARAGPGVSPASPWARATPHPGATKMEKKKNTIHTKKIKK